jgi:SAM-dependent methyltransferase
MTNHAAAYDLIDSYIVDIYDQTETQVDDVELLLALVGDRPRRILEPFCGNGRILLPLARAGHEVVGIDNSDCMLRDLAKRSLALPAEAQERLSCVNADATAEEWPRGFDLVVLGGNCFYELATATQQEQCIRSAEKSLQVGGYLFLDNNHMEGGLSEEWQTTLGPQPAFPSGLCRDGTRVSGTRETLAFDVEKRLIRFRRTVTVESPDGSVSRREWIQQKHPPSTEEMQVWLQRYGFVVEELWGDRNRSPYEPNSERAVYWARKA